MRIVEYVGQLEIPDWVEYLAQDSDGMVWGFGTKPSLEEFMDWWGTVHDMNIVELAHGKVNPNFRDACFHIDDNWKFDYGILSLKD